MSNQYIQCCSCGKTSDSVPLIPIPEHFIYEWSQWHLTTSGAICLECLKEKIEQRIKFYYENN